MNRAEGPEGHWSQVFPRALMCGVTVAPAKPSQGQQQCCGAHPLWVRVLQRLSMEINNYICFGRKGSCTEDMGVRHRLRPASRDECGSLGAGAGAGCELSGGVAPGEAETQWGTRRLLFKRQDAAGISEACR